MNMIEAIKKAIDEEVERLAETAVFLKDEDALEEARRFDEPDVNYEGGWDDLSDSTKDRLIEEAREIQLDSLQDFIPNVQSEGFEVLSRLVKNESLVCEICKKPAFRKLCSSCKAQSNK